jgi:hypothetical protein
MLCHMSKVQATEQSSFFLMEMNCCEKNVQENGRIQVNMDIVTQSCIMI